MTDRIWLKHYGADTPPEIDAGAWPSLTALIDDRVRRFHDLPAFSSFGTRMRYGEFDSHARAFGAYLRNNLGLAAGDRIAVMLPNLLQFPVAMHGAHLAGLVVVNVNPLYTPRELEYQLNDAGAETIVILAGATPVLADIVDRTPVRNVIVTQLDDLLGSGLPMQPVDERLEDWIGFPTILRTGDRSALKSIPQSGDELAFLQYTGGTTGRSKGAMLTHRNMVANVMQVRALYSTRLREGQEVFITALPLYHIFGLTVNLASALDLGACNVLIANPRDTAGMVEEMSRWQFTFITGVNTLYNGLLHTPGFPDLDFSRLQVAIAGGMALQGSVAKRWREVTGMDIQQGYGLSETAPCLSGTPVHATDRISSIGIPLPSTDMCIRDDNGGEVPPGTPGELCARGPQVMAGYWNRPEETRNVMTDDGYFRTGDIAVMDEEGFFYIVDRKKDMIIVSGFNVYPNEVEDVASGLEGVRECACIGVPAEASGEAVMLFVVAQPEAQLTAEAVDAWCRERLAPYKVPAVVRFTDEIPKSNVGKILRRALRERVAAESPDTP